VDDDRAPVAPAPAPSLLVLTGASHTGKTSVAREILRIVEPPAALLSVDDVLRQVLVRPNGDPWAEIPVAYDLLHPQVEALLGHGWLVVFESTFTYVPDSGAPEFHNDALDQLIAIAERLSAPCMVVQLRALGEDVSIRAEGSGRLSPEIIAQTSVLHESVALPSGAVYLDSSSETPRELAERLLTLLSRVH
jgi:predicted kinase